MQKTQIAKGAVFLLGAIAFAGVFWATSPALLQEDRQPIVLEGVAGGTQVSSAPIGQPLAASETYSLCFQYNTKGLAKPAVALADSSEAQELRLDLPRNTWGLGQACLRLHIANGYSTPRLKFMDSGDGSSFTVAHWKLVRSGLLSTRMFDKPAVQNQWGSFSIENNYLRTSFLMPLAVYVLLWMGSGVAITALIWNLNKSEILTLAPITGAGVIAFSAYFLSLFGIYTVSLLFLLVIALSLCAVYLRLRLSPQGHAPMAPAAPPPSRSDRIFDVVTAILIAWMMSKYVFVAFTPFYGTWDGLVSWNKWGTDWALREARGNYQFTYPQLVPLFYSAYYKLTGYTATDPLALAMNGAHLFSTFLELLSLPLLYMCSKALNIRPIFPFAILATTDAFFRVVNAGYVDNILVSYYLTAMLVVLRSGGEINTPAAPLRNAASLLAVAFLGASAVFLKQTGIFATAAIALFVVAYYPKTIFRRANIFLLAVVLLVPTEFYVHEIVLDRYPSLVEDNPLNHSIGGILSNAATQLSIMPTNATWYGGLAEKLAPQPIASHATGLVPLVFSVMVLGLYMAICYALWRGRRFRQLIAWSTLVGGLLIVAMKFGVHGEYRYVLFKWPVVALLAGVAISWLGAAIRSGKVARIANTSALLVAVLVAAVHIHKFHAAPPAGNGFDMISYESRLARFFDPEEVRVVDYLVSRPNQGFRFFTESLLVVWPYTIYDSFTKSTPTKMCDLYRKGDYYYSMLSSHCPQGFVSVGVDVGAHAFCVKP